MILLNLMKHPADAIVLCCHFLLFLLLLVFYSCEGFLYHPVRISVLQILALGPLISCLG